MIPDCEMQDHYGLGEMSKLFWLHTIPFKLVVPGFPQFKKTIIFGRVMLNSFLKSMSRSLFGQTEDPAEEQTVSQQFDAMTMYQEGQIHLFELNELLIEKIIEFLSIPALAAFRRTSKTSKQVRIPPY